MKVRRPAFGLRTVRHELLAAFRHKRSLKEGGIHGVRADVLVAVAARDAGLITMRFADLTYRSRRKRRRWGA